eukprot:scaffold19997_cov67-Phaeocystis_antarctica.AAC.1
MRTYRRVASRTGVAGRRIAEGYGGRAPPVHGAQPRSPCLPHAGFRPPPGTWNLEPRRNLYAS